MFKKRTFWSVAVYFLSLALAYFAWEYAHEQNINTAKQRFSQNVHEVLRENIKDRVDAYVNTLYGLQGLYYADGGVNGEHWRTYLSGDGKVNRGAEFFVFLKKSPAAVAEGTPSSDFEIFSQQSSSDSAPYSLSFIEPRSASADFLFSRLRDQEIISSINQAVKSALPFASPPFMSKETVGRTFFVFLPAYAAFSAGDESRSEKSLDGLFAVSLRAEDALQHALTVRSGEVNVEIFDVTGGRKASVSRLLYDSYPQSIEALSPTRHVLNVTSFINVGGRRWQIYQSAPLDFGLTAFEKMIPGMILGGGIFISALLFMLFYSLALVGVKAERLSREMTEKFRGSEERVHAILHSIADGVFVVDAKKQVLLANKSAAVLAGWKQEEITGRNSGEVFCFAGEDGAHADFGKRLDHALKKGRVAKAVNHTVLVRKDGNKISVAESIAPIRGDNDKVVGCVVVFRDVSKERAIEKMKDEFISLASHQLRTPLTAIKLFTEMLVKQEVGPLNAKQREYMDSVYQSTGRMVRLVSDLLNVSRIESGRLKVEPEPTQLSMFLKDIIKEFTAVAKAHNCEIALRVSSKMPLMVPIDPTLARQVVHNLINNAMRYAPPDKSKITVSLSIDKSRNYIISVADQGIGIPKEAEDRIFQKFFRADNAVKAAADGSGLGLYIAKMIMRSAGGEIWYKSARSGKGTTFYVKIPRTGMNKKGGDKGLSPIL